MTTYRVRPCPICHGHPLRRPAGVACKPCATRAQGGPGDKRMANLRPCPDCGARSIGPTATRCIGCWNRARAGVTA